MQKMSKAKRELLAMIREQRARLDPRMLDEMRELLDRAGMIPEAARGDDAPAASGAKPEKPAPAANAGAANAGATEADSVPYDSEAARAAIKLFLENHDDPDRMEKLIRDRLNAH